MNQENAFEAVVIGSGFGGSILSLSLANKFESDNAKYNTNKKVCVLERGQWWVTHELDCATEEKRTAYPNIREYLEENKRPYHFWAHPDNIKGALRLLSTARGLRRTGLYGVRMLGNISVICASGLGGGSLIYSNVILAPRPGIFQDWPTRFEGKNLEDYFDIARDFIGVNRVTTISGSSEKKLEKSKVFMEAGQELIDNGDTSIVNIKNENGRIVGDFELDLSVTDAQVLDRRKGHPEKEIIRSSRQENVCQREGRCIFGCIHGARHTFDIKLIDAINPRPPAKPKPIEIRELGEAYDIEFKEDMEYRYTINYFQYDPETEKRKTKKIHAKNLIIAAGGMGSSELLMKCKERGHLELSEMLGKKFFLNGDILAYMTLESRSVDITKGPMNTAYIAFKTDERDFAYTISDTTISRMVAPAFATMFDLHVGLEGKTTQNFRKKLVRDLRLLRRFRAVMLLFRIMPFRNQINLFSKAWNHNAARRILRDVLRAATTENTTTYRFMERLLASITTDYADPRASIEKRMSKFFVFSCMGRGEKPGVLKLKPQWEDMEKKNDPGEKLFVEWPAEENNWIFKEIIKGVRKIAGKIEKGGEKRVFTPYWNLDEPGKSAVVSLHPLGGCSMGENVEKGVVDSFGRVFQNDGSSSKKKVYPGLYVIDGSVLPDTVGVNPALTIAAIAFRAAEKMVGREFLPVSLRVEEPPEPVQIPEMYKFLRKHCQQ